MKRAQLTARVVAIAVALAAIAGRAYALSCVEPHRELRLQIASVEVDGVPQEDLTELSSREVTLWVFAPGAHVAPYGFVELHATEDGYFIYQEHYDAPSAADR